ncbi:acetyl-CoA carboxyl transferase [Arthrobacter sp. MYb211]|uniref:carboxyl transferase domain-containing protein n=1 Tax=unclassified Arthrobacter TaxID=235627 RepID=UPI000CFB0EF3|nr:MULTISPECIES: carboxyl transferase domain-containing protein [unclassified Arthrobacter]PRA10457.1 acetyl-CoA carboxyl transferase [Arthrobacter sp. MYb221]PRC06026.1 acetyl-CoA carboxyl transferase [Arthrobacter sp. MYb211]
MNTKTARLGAAELLGIVLDEGSFESWDSTPHQPELSESYAADLDAARLKSGADESVLTGKGMIQGRPVAVIVSEFKFLAGSIGQAAVKRIVAAITRATSEGLPLLAGPASGGTRMQEGTLAFLGMVAITDAVRRHKEAGLAYLVYLRHPTTGGVMASWGSLGHITVAEPEALLGFLGPRVYEALSGEKFPEGVQVSENLFRKGLIDAVVAPQELPELVLRALRILQPTEVSTSLPAPLGRTVPGSTPDVWESVQISRNPRRPDTRMVLASADDALPLNGTGQGEKDPGLILSLARFGDQRCVVLGQQRPRHLSTSSMGPASLREARRGMQLAQELGLALVTIIDTTGAELSAEAEEGGLAGEIARSLSELIGLRSPSVSVLLGQGTGGAALALLPADRTIAAQNSWLSPLPPEGASAIIHRSIEQAPQMARAQRIGVGSLCAFGLVDHVVDELDEAAGHPREFAQKLCAAIAAEVSLARVIPDEYRLGRRQQKFQNLGTLGT